MYSSVGLSASARQGPEGTCHNDHNQPVAAVDLEL